MKWIGEDGHIDTTLTGTLSEEWNEWRWVDRFSERPIAFGMGHNVMRTDCPECGPNYMGNYHINLR